MNITLIISSLGGGGAERSLVNLANALSERGHVITLMTLRSDVPDVYVYNSKIARVYATPPPYGWQRWFDLTGQLKRLKRNWDKIALLRQDILNTNPDIVISFIDTTNVVTLRALLFNKVPIIVSERIDFRFHPLNGGWQILRFLLYCSASKVVVQTCSLENWIKSRCLPWKVCTIPNFVNSINRKNYNGDHILKIRLERYNEKRFGKLVAAGRLVYQKGFDLLIQAYAKIFEQFPDWNLTIFGEGEDRDFFMSQATKFGLDRRVVFQGRVTDLEMVFMTADIFILSSRYEGFPNVLLEAMGCGLPVISFDCLSGPREIIRHGVDGLLVSPGNISALAEAMSLLMSNPAKRLQMSRRALDVYDRFSCQHIVDLWESLLQELAI